MTEYAKLVVSVDSRQVKTADADLSKLSRTAGTTERSTDQLTGAFRRLAGPLAAVISARQIAQAAEGYTTLTNRLRLVTNGTEELVAAQEAVFQIAQESRQPLAATAELYQRIAANSQELGLSANEIVSIVDTVNKTLAISGSSAQTASGALVQLGQAFASGALRGEELNAVLEAAPPLAKAIADGLGVSVGQLRELGKEGKLSADAVAQAIIKQGDAIDQSFGKIETTGGQALTVLGNSLTKLVGDLNEASGAGTIFGDTIIGLAQYIDSGALTDSILETFSIWSGTFSAASQDLVGLGADLDAFAFAGAESADFIGTAFQQMPANIRAAVQIATVEVASFFDIVGRKAAATAAQVFAYVKGGEEAASRVARAAAADIETQVQARDESLDSILKERDAIIQAGEARRKQAQEEREIRKAERAEREKQIADLRDGLKGTNIKLGGAGDAAKQAKDAAREAKRLTDLYATNEQQLARQVALFGVTTEAARVRYEVENGDLSKLNAQQQLRLVGLAEELDRLEQLKKEREETEATDEYTAALRGQIEARRNAIDIEVEAIGIGTRQAENLRELNALEFEYAKRLEELARVQGTSAALSAEAYQARVDALRTAMEQEVAIVKEGAARKAGAEASALNGIKKGTADYVDEAANLSKQFEQTTTKTLTGLEDGLVSFVKTGKLDFKSLADSIITDLIRIAARQAIAGVFGGGSGGGIGAIGGGGGSSGASTATGLLSLFSSFAGFFDRGGPIPAGGFGIVGENGPEIVSGPAQVTGRKETAQMMGGRSVSVGQMVFPGVTNAAEAKKASAAAARELGRLAQGTGRYM